MYIVIELQTTNNETSTLVNSYVSKPQAEQKYHTILSFASVSEVEQHCAVMLDSEGRLLKSECYKH